MEEKYLPADTGSHRCFQVGNTVVRVVFTEQGKTLKERLRAYFLSLKS